LEVGAEKLEQFTTLPIVKIAIKRLGRVGELLDHRGARGHPVGIATHASDIVRTIGTASIAPSASAGHRLLKLGNAVITNGRLKTGPILFLVSGQAETRLQPRNLGIDLVACD
jgi:hypothetical protein